MVEYDIPWIRIGPLPESPSFISAAPVWSNSTVKLINFESSFNDKSLASKISFDASDFPLLLINLFISETCFKDKFTFSSCPSISYSTPYLKFFNDLS